MKMRMTEILNKFFKRDFWVEKTSFHEYFQKKKIKRKRKHELIIEKGTGSANW